MNMGKKHEIWQQVDHRHGFTEPGSDYFEQFTSRMMEQLPELEIPQQEPVTLWTRIQPWLYMAAMFVGIYLIVNMFHSISSAQESNLLAEEQFDEEYYEELIWTSNVSDCSVYEYFADAYEY